MAKYEWRTKPYKHQVKAIKRAASLDWNIALLMEPRTGKTKTTIDAASILSYQGKIDRMVVVCPARVMDVWRNELHTHSPCRLHITMWDAKERARGLTQVPHTQPGDLYVIIVNYEAFSTPGRRTESGRRSKTTGRFKVRSQLQKWISGQPTLGVLDESHKIKSPSGKAATMLVSMRNDFRYRMLLTGTPVTKANRAHDIYMQWKFLNPSRFEELATADDFKNQYGRWVTKNGFNQWVAPRNLDEFVERVHEDSFAVKRADCFDLPPRDDQIIRVKLKPQTAKAYDEMAEQMITHWKVEDSLRIKAEREANRLKKSLESMKDPIGKEAIKAEIQELQEEAQEHTIEASIKLVQSLRLCQITSGFAKTDEGLTVRIGTEKLDALKELVEDAQEHEEKVVIAARFKPDLDAIALLGRSMGIPTFELRGGLKRSEATANIASFKNHDGCALFVMQPQAGSLGIDLSTASRMVWYSLTTSYVDFTQSCDRIALSRNSTTFTYLLAEGTYDEVLLEGLNSDKGVAEYVLKRPEKLMRSK